MRAGGVHLELTSAAVLYNGAVLSVPGVAAHLTVTSMDQWLFVEGVEGTVWVWLPW